jgi:AcrR family transcriptional regulator
MDDSCAKPRPRERIVEMASALFRRHGIRGIGVDAIAEAAGTNKMTLYRHFGSKDELIAECLRAQVERVDQRWTELERANPANAEGQLRAWIALAAEYISTDGGGCDLSNAAIELRETDHPARLVIEEFKQAQRNRLVSVCKAAGAADGDLLADTLYLLLEGARVSRQSVGADGPCSRFVRAADAVVVASIGTFACGASAATGVPISVSGRDPAVMPSGITLHG